MNYKDGIHDISNHDYHASDAISRSNIMRFMRSPWHYKNPTEFKETPSMALGSAVHCLTLEPHLFTSEFAIEPELNKRTKQGKYDYERFVDESGGKILITQKLYEQAYIISKQVHNNDYANRLLKDAVVEQSIFWKEPNDLQFKSRPDAMQDNIIIDLKTTVDASPKAFSHSALKYGYFMQAAMARRALSSIGREMESFIIIAVETSEPYAVATYILDSEAIDYAEKEFLRISDELRECIASNRWPSYEPQYITIPNYLMRSDDE